MKTITPQDYIDAQGSLARAGFQAIVRLLDEDKTVTDVATTFGIDELAVEVVATTKDYQHYDTVYRLENEREALVQEKQNTEDAKAKKPTLTKWQWTWGSALLLAIVVGIVWGIVMLFRLITGNL